MQDQKKRMSTGAKVGFGCGIGCLTVVLLIVVAGFAGYHFFMNKVDAYTEELKDLGFEKVESGQMITVTETVDEPTLYRGQVVKILGNVQTNVAVLAQMCEVHGTIDGKLFFRGQMLVVQPSGHIKGGLDAQAQMVQNMGKIDGEIKSTGQVIQVPASEDVEVPLTRAPEAETPEALPLQPDSATP